MPGVRKANAYRVGVDSVLDRARQTGGTKDVERSHRMDSPSRFDAGAALRVAPRADAVPDDLLQCVGKGGCEAT
jgi:hypothetical protein